MGPCTEAESLSSRIHWAGKHCAADLSLESRISCQQASQHSVECPYQKNTRMFQYFTSTTWFSSQDDDLESNTLIVDGRTCGQSQQGLAPHSPESPDFDLAG